MPPASNATSLNALVLDLFSLALLSVAATTV